ncbi:MAG TPA: hypothetical protein EYQ14_14935 [Gammaproteobacteria bacterium]|nr:hypothetical protein [Gammaproteobacteria bacterium]HIL95580.1 hypothetical protein [Pseudomonadales bacterium]
MRMIADTVYTNGTIYTVNQAEPWAEAVALKDGKFIAVGTRSLAGIASRGHDQTTHQPVFQG